LVGAGQYGSLTHGQQTAFCQLIASPLSPRTSVAFAKRVCDCDCQDLGERNGTIVNARGLAVSVMASRHSERNFISAQHRKDPPSTPGLAADWRIPGSARPPLHAKGRAPFRATVENHGRRNRSLSDHETAAAATLLRRGTRALRRWQCNRGGTEIPCSSNRFVLPEKKQNRRPSPIARR